MLAAAIKKAESVGKLHPDCCVRKGFFWDLIAAYAPGSHWGDVLPEPVLLNGPVVDHFTALEAIMQKIARTRKPAGRFANYIVTPKRMDVDPLDALMERFENTPASAGNNVTR